MSHSHDNDNAPERLSWRLPASIFSFADGLRCPRCYRATRMADFKCQIEGFELTCGGCGLTLLTYEEAR
jgi:hypothetical protein